MRLRELDHSYFNLRCSKNLNLQVSSTVVTSTVMPSMHNSGLNSGLKGNFQIAIWAQLAYLDKGAKRETCFTFGARSPSRKYFFFYEKFTKVLTTNGTNISHPPCSFPKLVLSLFSPSQVPAGVLASVIFLCVMPFFWSLSFVSFSVLLSLFSFLLSAVSFLFNQNLLTC